MPSARQSVTLGTFSQAHDPRCMPDLHYRALPAHLRPLADKFYRTHRSAMRPRHDDTVWVAQQGDILAALCLAPMDDGRWLTGLFVAPAFRGQGLAGQLLSTALADADGPTWLFCHPDLASFYQRLGFAPTSQLPALLAQRLSRYQCNKNLIALSA